MKKKILIVGGGAAGIMAGITAASHDADVTILEHRDRIGSKLLLTGNGRCNLTNLVLSSQDYCTYSDTDTCFVQSILQKVTPEHILEFFHALGMRTTVLRDSYVYPETEAAASVLMVLLRELKRLSVKIKTGVHVKKIREEKEALYIETTSDTYCADEVILACGGASYPKTGSDGSGFLLLRDLQLNIFPPYPALTAFVCKNSGQRILSGLRQNADAQLYFQGKKYAETFGQVQFTDYGISGIPIFCISSFLVPILMQHDEKIADTEVRDKAYTELLKKYQDKLLVKLDLFPAQDTAEVAGMLEKQSEAYGEFAIEEALEGVLHKKWIHYLIHKFSFAKKPMKELKKDDIFLLAKELKGVKFPITDLKGYDFCQITGGGLSLNETERDFSLKKYPHIRVIGELLNVTGKCGGYNLHWAFASGMIAGRAAAGVEDIL